MLSPFAMGCASRRIGSRAFHSLFTHPDQMVEESCRDRSAALVSLTLLLQRRLTERHPRVAERRLAAGVSVIDTS